MNVLFGTASGAEHRPRQTKPPYHVPSMGEILAVPWNGLTAASTFAGCGGSCTGYRMAGYRVVWANEFEPHAVECYRLNHQDTILDTRSIRGILADDILGAIGIASGELDILDGSPPCQPFSMAGTRHKSWNKTIAHGDGTTQRSDDLFLEYVRLLDGLKPKVFVAENVSGLVKGVAKGYFKIILRAMRECGYSVECRLLDAQCLGVPQTRVRTIFVGVREDLECMPVFPQPLPYRYSVADALQVAVGDRNFSDARFVDVAEEPSVTILAGGDSGRWRSNERSTASATFAARW